eukprot:PLAT3316.1.p1 GENE.PLAT3316.1~~PLAT3316.1.p1  ORF type:complete len:164 (-),score=63.81 PLAT3316.1:248-739(-)
MRLCKVGACHEAAEAVEPGVEEDRRAEGEEGEEEVASSKWTLWWASRESEIKSYSLPAAGQTRNRVIGMPAFAAKKALNVVLQRALALYPARAAFSPRTWCLLEDAEAAQAAVGAAAAPTERFFIYKPDMGMQGDGIWLASSMEEDWLTTDGVLQDCVEIEQL